MLPDPPDQGEKPPTLTTLVARRLQEIGNTADLPAELKQKVGLCLLDFLAAVISGLGTDAAPPLLLYAQTRQRDAPEAFVWGSEKLLSAPDAAFVNAALAHSVIRDDMHLSAGSHIGVMIIPAALALAQKHRWSGMQLVKATIGGYEMAVRLGTAIRQGEKVNAHFRPSGITGAFGATSAAFAAMPASEDIVVNGLGFAANMACGLNEWPWAGGQEIFLHMGTAARSGMDSFDLAMAGLRSSPTILEGRNGFFQAYEAGARGANVFRKSLEDNGSGWSTGILDTKFKPFAGCNMIQTPLAVALALHPKISEVKLRDIEEVVIFTTTPARDYPGCNNTGPFPSVQSTKMSLQYGVSSALLFGRVDEATYNKADDSDLRQLVRKCTVGIGEDFDESFAQGQQPARIELKLKDGREHEEQLRDVPWLQAEQVTARFRREATEFMTSTDIEEMIKLSQRLCELEDCSNIFDRLRGLDCEHLNGNDNP